MAEFLLGLIVGVIGTYLIVRYRDQISDAVQTAADRVSDADPEIVTERAQQVRGFFRRNALWIGAGLLVVLIVLGSWVYTSFQSREISLGDYVVLVDSCGNKHNVQIQQPHLDQGFVVISPDTECELTQPLLAK